MTTASDLRVRVRLYAADPVTLAGGGLGLHPRLVETLWADLRPASSRQLFEANQRHLRVTHSLTLRYRADLLDVLQRPHAYLVVVDGREGTPHQRRLHVRSVVERNERHVWLDLMVEEGEPA